MSRQKYFYETHNTTCVFVGIFYHYIFKFFQRNNVYKNLYN